MRSAWRWHSSLQPVFRTVVDPPFARPRQARGPLEPQGDMDGLVTGFEGQAGFELLPQESEMPNDGQRTNWTGAMETARPTETLPPRLVC